MTGAVSKGNAMTDQDVSKVFKKNTSQKDKPKELLPVPESKINNKQEVMVQFEAGEITEIEKDRMLRTFILSDCNMGKITSEERDEMLEYYGQAPFSPTHACTIKRYNLNRGRKLLTQLTGIDGFYSADLDDMSISVGVAEDSKAYKKIDDMPETVRVRIKYSSVHDKPLHIYVWR